MYVFDRSQYFDAVRDSLFAGKLTQQQVDGQECLLDVWEDSYWRWDMRWLAYALATTIHETAATMWPIEEYGKGKGKPYGVPDPVTGQTYYGRGDVQLTWLDNYRKMNPIVQAIFPDRIIDLVNDPAQALDPDIAAAILFEGMARGTFRPPNSFGTYFSNTKDDPYTAREIVNGDKTKVPNWSHGLSIGTLIKGYHNDFLAALTVAKEDVEQPEPTPPQVDVVPVRIDIKTPPGVRVLLTLNGEVII